MIELNPDKYLRQITEAGDPTLYSVAFGESMHSMAGAREETEIHYWQGCQMENLLRQNSEIHLLEVGLGMGLGIKVTLENRQKMLESALQNTTLPPGKLKILSFDLEDELIKYVLEVELKNWVEKYQILNDENLSLGNIYLAHGQDIELTILQGDATKNLGPFLGKGHFSFHAIYQDAFSPRRNPDLWSQEWFSLLAKHSRPGARLSTYSASLSMRKALWQTGWGISIGPGHKQKKQSTRACLQGPSCEKLLQLINSPALKCW